ncbi:MAG: polysaccharide deacetylase family protein [Bacteroidales bacterium]|nr:polysaccharide deacetylase family protein [Bacteroidales bacterium]
MLNPRTIIMLTAAILITVLLTDMFIQVPIWIYAVTFLPAISLFAYGSVSIRSGFYVKTLCSAKTQKKEIAVSFDDGPDRNITPAVLDVLLKNNIQAVFFCIGEKVREYPDLIRRMHAEGHIVGNHSHSHHAVFDLYSCKRIRRELKQTENLIYEVIGERTKLFRPPYGVTNPAVAAAAKSLGYNVIGWSLKSKDTVIHEQKALLKRLKTRLRKGDVVLFHDRGNHLGDVLKEFIQYTLNENYRFVRIDKLLNIKAYA